MPKIKEVKVAEFLDVVALRPVSLYDEDQEAEGPGTVNASEKDVKKGEVFRVPNSPFYQHKISPEGILALKSMVEFEPDDDVDEPEDSLANDIADK